MNPPEKPVDLAKFASRVQRDRCGDRRVLVYHDLSEDKLPDTAAECAAMFAAYPPDANVRFSHDDFDGIDGIAIDWAEDATVEDLARWDIEDQARAEGTEFSQRIRDMVVTASNEMEAENHAAFLEATFAERLIVRNADGLAVGIDTSRPEPT